ncbi:hypothetical protein A0H81_07024 [Grifola frondosa]|uniref:Uncharacterized protein n=1 Tax=Grifola frondosa TaxID=5627 RepID=A0A1C7M7K8_GRIFR|nr:hypothetical protein A0H81_07024 [Grifola frondosa]
MRDKLRTLSAITSIPRLYGLSVMGTRFAVYTLDRDTGHVEPECIAPGASDVNDTAPQAWWKFDVTTEAGCKRFEEVVGDVKVMSAALS